MQLINNYHGRVGAAYTPSHNPNTRTNFAASYVTGSHAFKSGIDLAWAERGAWTGSVVPYSYIVSTLANNGRGGLPVPTQPDVAIGRVHRSAGPPGQRRADGADDDVQLEPALSDVRERQDRHGGRRVRPGPVDDGPGHAEPRLASGLVQCQPALGSLSPRRSSRRTATSTCRRSRASVKRTGRRRWARHGTCSATARPR